MVASAVAGAERLKSEVVFGLSADSFNSSSESKITSLEVILGSVFTIVNVDHQGCY